MAVTVGYEDKLRTCWDGRVCSKQSSSCNKCLITHSGIDNYIKDYQYI